MACDITTGRNRPCKTGLGGTKVVYLFNELEDSFTVAAGVGTAMNVALTEAFKFELEGTGNNLVQSMVAPRDTFSRVNTQTLTLVLKSMDVATNANFNLLVAGFSHAVVVDNNSNYLVIGIDDGIDWTVETNTGGAKSDANSYTLTGVAEVSELAPILDTSTRDAFLDIVA